MLESQQRRDLVHYRIEKAYKSFDEAKGVAKLKYWNLTGNRLYYTVFHMASALLLDKGFTAKTHAGVIHLVASSRHSILRLWRAPSSRGLLSWQGKTNP